MSDTVSIFILPPSRAELERRLRSRASDSEETILRRLADVRRDLEHAGEFDYVVVNDTFDSALDEICSVVEHRRRGAVMPKRDHAALLADLLRI
jgi:guanylate kinase